MQTKSKNRLLLLFSLLAPLILGCEELRPRAANGVRAGLDCQAENLQAVIAEAAALARAAVLGAIDGSGMPDTEALRAAARGLKSDGLRCAFAAAVAALASPAPASKVSGPGLSSMLTEQPVNGEKLVDAFKDIALTEWGVGGTILTNQGAL